ncbi:heat shock protein DnaJ domain protein [Thalassoporum mexicanum PCC 7367]|uniref:J domain-containing protein n=1 Tax=Thalassoporum mexicanum TaxID=3457544 RepID=UPI00029F9FC7|nr:DnaJ domain-containing protein [Pseudanabaena sp. PCC 7367]AFY70236.1 heat shock protein DnaJ domain protein [Pseudanabaena sp. PCC 7367]
MAKDQTYYQILELASSASAEQIKSAYRRLARKYHPDLNGDDQVARDRFEQVTQAYRILAEPASRSDYDRHLNSGNSQFDPRRSPSSQHTRLYEQGLLSLQDGNYNQAIVLFSRALDYFSNFAEAYLKRAVAHYRNGNAAAAVTDLNRAIELKPQLNEAYYQRGLARSRLGYDQSAIEDYDQAIELNPNYGQAFYRRGLLQRDLGNETAAQQDLQAAVNVFIKINDPSGRQLAQDALAAGGNKSISLDLPNLQLKLPISGFSGLFQPLQSTGLALRLFAINPLGGLLPAYVKVGDRAVYVALVLTALFEVCLVGGVYFLWWQHFGYATAPSGRIALAGLVLFLSLAVISFFLRSILRGKGSFTGDLFMAAATLVPLGMVAIAAGLYTLERSILLLCIALICGCYSILTVYSGFSQLANLNETRSTLATALLVAIAGLIIQAGIAWLMPDAIPSEGIV